MNNWWENYTDVVAFGRHMVEAEGWSANELVEYLEKPWKWSDERTAWLAQ